MNRALAVPAIALAILTGGLTLAALPTYGGVGTPTPSVSAASVLPPALTIPCQEDEPCWRCATMGNGICGPDAGAGLDTLTAADAWAAWTSQDGARKLRVDGTRKFTVEYVGYAINRPHLEPGQLALQSGATYYVFAARYLD
jgi:hypothetical protein